MDIDPLIVYCWKNLDRDDLNAFHDVLLEALNSSPSEQEIESIFYRLEKDIIRDVSVWGMCDACVRERIYSYIKENFLKDD